MEPITIGLIIINLIFGAVVGFATIIADDPRLMGIIQAGGLCIFMVEIFAFLPSLSLQSHIEISAVTDSMGNIIYAFLSYIFGDVAFGIGAGMFLGKS